MGFGINPLEFVTETLQDKLLPPVILLKQIKFILGACYVKYTFLLSFTSSSIHSFIHSYEILVCCNQCAYWKKTGNVHCEH